MESPSNFEPSSLNLPSTKIMDMYLPSYPARDIGALEYSLAEWGFGVGG